MAGGGIKSAVAAAAAASGEHQAALVHVDFGQASARAELAAVEAQARLTKTARVVRLDLPYLGELRLRLMASTGVARSTERYDADDAAAVSAGMARGLMPSLLTMGVQCGQRLAAGSVVTGLCRHGDVSHLGLGGLDDQADSLREFLHNYEIMMECILPVSTRIPIEAPLMDLEMAEILKLAKRFEVPLEHTWTCAQAGPRPCGRCEGCRARDRAFAEIGWADPLLPQARVLRRTSAGAG